MREFQVALKDANIQFREDEQGYVRYRQEDAAAAEKILENLDKELHSGISIKYDDEETTRYLREMLTSMGMKYRIEKRDDGEWTRWYPQNDDQRRDIPRKVVEHVFELKKRQLSEKCAQSTLFTGTPPSNARSQKVSGTC